MLYTPYKIITECIEVVEYKSHISCIEILVVLTDDRNLEFNKCE